MPLPNFADNTDNADVFVPSSEFAVRLLLELSRHGVQQLVVSPGSRSQALALAAAELADAGLVSLRVRVDERSAGFLGLGMAMGSGSPVGLITTSGSAVGNLLPAVMEAHHKQVPLLLLTADRPDYLRGTGANQTTNQPEIFKGFTGLSLDIPVQAYNNEPQKCAAKIVAQVIPVLQNNQPVHLNLQFVEPLSGAHTPIAQLVENAATGSEDHAEQKPAQHELISIRVPAEGSVFIAGEGASKAHAEFAAKAGIPVIAEITSNAREFHNVPDYRNWLDGHGSQIRRLIVSGRPNLSRQSWRIAERLAGQVQSELEKIPAGSGRSSAASLKNSNNAGSANPGGPEPQLIVITEQDLSGPTPETGIINPHPELPLTKIVNTVEYLPSPDEQYFDGYIRGKRHDSGATAALSSLADSDDSDAKLTRENIVKAVWGASHPTQDAIYLASSAMVRVADEQIATLSLPVYSHRGLAGIDGTIAAASGVAYSRQRTSAQGSDNIVRLIIGDLAYAHDASSLLMPEGESHPPLQIIVVNDRGGYIFSTLEVAQSNPQHYDRVVRTPQQLNVTALAATYGWPVVKARALADLRDFLADRKPGVIEIEL